MIVTWAVIHNLIYLFYLIDVPNNYKTGNYYAHFDLNEEEKKREIDLEKPQKRTHTHTNHAPHTYVCVCTQEHV